jgi:diguanylate cyclase (GGDEF)-like protein
MIQAHLPALLVDLQYVFLGVALQLGSQLLFQWRRTRSPESVWMGLWCLSIAVALAANLWVLASSHGGLQTAFDVRALGAALVLCMVIPTIATLAGRPVPWLLEAAVVGLLALRSLLIATTELIIRHHTTSEGASVAGPINGLFWLTVLALILGYSVITIRRWREPEEQSVVIIALALTVLLGLAGIVSTGPTSELLAGYWVVPQIIALAYISLKRDSDAEDHERELVVRQEAVLRELADSYLRNRLALRSGGLGWFDYSATEGGMKVSPEFLDLVGLDQQSPLASVLSSIPALDPDRVDGVIVAAMQGGTASVEVAAVRPDTTTRWLSLTAMRVDEGPGSSRIIGVGRDITQRRQSEELLHHRAFHDSLTGLPNRAALMSALAEIEVRRSPVALLVLDLDQFKDINDTLGHVVGDELIAAVAGRLSRSLPPDGFLARMGGDEFAALVPALDTWREGECPPADDLLRSLEPPIALDGIRFSVRASLGVVRAPEDGSDPMTLLRKADAAMYRAKSQQRGTWSLFTALDDEATSRRLRLASDLPMALEGPDFSVHYQPSVWIDTGRVYALEALSRWQHPELGAIPPTEFVPLAESYGLGLALLRRVLREALTECKRWRDAGLAEKVTINVSPLTLRAPTFATSIDQALEAAGLPFEALVLEMTEEAFADAFGDLNTTLHTLRSRGVSIAIDDFGTGYSCLSNIGRLPVDTVKLDRGFVAQLPDDRAANVVVRSTIDLALGLGLLVVAEGVWSAEVVEFLEGCGCQLVQGYWICPPEPAEQILPWLEWARSGNPAKPSGVGNEAGFPRLHELDLESADLKGASLEDAEGLEGV